MSWLKKMWNIVAGNAEAELADQEQKKDVKIKEEEKASLPERRTRRMTPSRKNK